MTSRRVALFCLGIFVAVTLLATSSACSSYGYGYDDYWYNYRGGPGMMGPGMMGPGMMGPGMMGPPFYDYYKKKK